MTERKPPEISYTSWVDQQINEAAKRGAFDNLPGAGKPLPKRPDGDGQTWLRDYLRREGVSAEELLPTPLKLRREIERLTDTVQGLRSEQEVREVVAGINRRILEWRRIPEGPPVFMPLVKADEMVSRWRDARPAPSDPPSAPASHTTGRAASPFPRRRWWHRALCKTRSRVQAFSACASGRCRPRAVTTAGPLHNATLHKTYRLGRRG